MGAHLSVLAVGLITGGLATFIGPLAILLIKRDSMPFVADHAREALNFNLTLLCGVIAFTVVALAFSFVTLGLGVFIVAPLSWALGVGVLIAWLVCTIIAAVRASEGVPYHYPFTYRFIG